MSEPHENANPTIYTLGFAFQHMPKQAVCLIEKQKPEWQRGRLNGVGGKCEDGEMPATSMSREFYEETGVKMPVSDWTKFFVMRFRNGAVVHCFTAHLPDDQTPATRESERVDLYEIGRNGRWYQPHPIISNLNWLIPMAYHELTKAIGERMVVAE